MCFLIVRSFFVVVFVVVLFVCCFFLDESVAEGNTTIFFLAVSPMLQSTIIVPVRWSVTVANKACC